MRLLVVLRFAKVLMMSRLRSSTRSSVLKSITSRPILILVIGIVLFPVLLLAGIATVAFLKIGGLAASDIDQFVISIFTGMPLFLTGFYFTMGVLWELNASAESESTDAINWLPISPGEYVIASSLSTTYTYSPVLIMAAGYTLPIAVLTGNLLVFFLFVPIVLLSSLTGSFGVEILRSGIARVSSAFGKVSGRLMILLRMIGIMLVLVFTQILFSGFLVARAVGSVVTGTPFAGLVPVFWPSLTMAKIVQLDAVGTIAFLTLSIMFLSSLAGVSLVLRARYWVVAPASVHFSTPGSMSGPSRLGRLGLSRTLVALLRRELRSATRRKEVVRLVAVPIIIPVMITFPLILSPTPPQNGSNSSQIVPLLLAGPFLFGLGLGALFLGMTAMGQEGRGVWNLCTLPLTAKVLVRAKILFTSLISTIGLVLGGIVTTFLFGLSASNLLSFLAIGFAVVLAEASLGVAIGSRFPDFSEGPRPRFITISGSILGSIAGIVGMLVMVAPVIAALFLRFYYRSSLLTPLAFSLSIGLGLLIALVGYASAIRPVEDILQEPPA